MAVVELARQAGVPAGVVNCIHGTKNAVDFVCDNPEIKAISFVGSDFVGQVCEGRRAGVALGLV